jgi:hypothetical protein
MFMGIQSTIVFAILIGLSASTAQERKTLTEAEAIHLAEQFVVENGYTDLPPTQDKSKFSYESIDSDDPDVALKARYNTLERNAYGVRGRDAGRHGWTVVFRYNHADEEYRRIIPDCQKPVETTGRAVTMEADGSGIRMQHQEFLLSGIKPIKMGSWLGIRVWMTGIGILLLVAGTVLILMRVLNGPKQQAPRDDCRSMVSQR